MKLPMSKMFTKRNSSHEDLTFSNRQITEPENESEFYYQSNVS